MSPSRLARLLGAASLALLVACATTLPERGRLAMRDVEFPLRDFELPSGLRVVVERDARNPVVAVVAVVGAGSTADPAGKEGLAHVVEHLAFRARHGGSPSVWTRLEALGAGRFNATTGLDATSYLSVAPREALGALLQLEVRRLSAPLEGVTPEVFAVEREVVRNELRQRNETGYVGQVFSWAQAATFPAGHPYARPVVGTHPSLTALQLEDAQAFARQHYRPDNVTLVVTGDVDLATVDALLEQALPAAWVGEGPPSAPAPRLAADAPATPPLAPAPAPAALPTFEAAVATPEVYVTWALPRGYDDASAVHTFVRAALARELSGAFADDEDIMGVGTVLVPGTQASMLVVRVALATGAHPQKSAEAVLDQVHRAWSTVGLGEVTGAQALFARRHRAATVALLLENDDVLARAAQRAELAHFNRDARAFNHAQRAMGALRASQVSAFGNTWLKRERARVFHVRPGERGTPALADVRPVPADVARSVPAAPAVEALRRALPVHAVTLPNGMEVLLAPRPGLPLVTVAVALAGGRASVGDAPGVPEVALALARQSSWVGDTSDWGLQASRWLSADHTRYALAGPAGNLANMLAMLAERLGNTTADDPRVLEEFRRHARHWQQAVDGRPEVQARRALWRALYGPTSAYGREATAEDLDRVTLEQAQAWLTKVHRPANAVAVIAGEFDPAQAEALVREHLGRWTGAPLPVATPASTLPAPPAQAPVLVTPRPGATQGQLTLACRLEGAGPEALARHEVMAAVVHERLWRTVRQQAGASYGFHAGVTALRGGAVHLEVQGVVDATQLAPTLQATQAALAPPEGPAGEAEVARARARLLSGHAVSSLTAEDWAHQLLQVRLYGWAPGDLARRPEHLRAVDTAAVRAELAACAARKVVGLTADADAARVAAGALE